MNKQQLIKKIDDLIDYCEMCNTEILNYHIDEEGINYIIEELKQIKKVIRGVRNVENSEDTRNKFAR